MQFKDIEGQIDVSNRLTQAVDAGRVPHAQMFVGKSSAGSLALAIAYAQYVGCQNRQHYGESGEGKLRADSCGCCPSCKKFRDLVHPDLHFFFPNTTTTRVTKNPSSAELQGEFHEFLKSHECKGTIEEWYDFLSVDNKQGLIRERDADDMLRILSMKSYEGGNKTVVVWMAEKMNGDAANTILKSLEEPSEGTIILLVVENSEKILSTIISRCQIVRVKEVANMEWRGKVEEYGQMYVGWMRQLFKLNMLSLSAWVDTMHARGREKQKEFLLFAMAATRDCMLNNMAGLPLHIDFGDEKFNSSFPKMINENDVELINKAFDEAIYAIERNGFAKLVFMELSFKISKALRKGRK